MFDFSSILEYMKIEPGHGLIQSILLFMIWTQSKGLRRELSGLRDSLLEMKNGYDQRFEQVEKRIITLESRGNK